MSIFAETVIRKKGDKKKKENKHHALSFASKYVSLSFSETPLVA